MIAYFVEKGLTFDFEQGEGEELSRLFGQMYVEFRQKLGDYYSKLSLLSFRAAVQRYFTVFGREINIYIDKEFVQANNILDGYLKGMKRDGFLKLVQYRDVIIDADYEKFMVYFTKNFDSVILTEKVWFFMTYYFCMRGCEN